MVDDVDVFAVFFDAVDDVAACRLVVLVTVSAAAPTAAGGTPNVADNRLPVVDVALDDVEEDALDDGRLDLVNVLSVRMPL